MTLKEYVDTFKGESVKKSKYKGNLGLACNRSAEGKSFQSLFRGKQGIETYSCKANYRLSW